MPTNNKTLYYRGLICSGGARSGASLPWVHARQTHNHFPPYGRYIYIYVYICIYIYVVSCLEFRGGKHPFVSLSLPVSVCLFLCFCLSPCVSVPVHLMISFSVFASVSLCFCFILSPYVSFLVCPFVAVTLLRPLLSFFVSLCVCFF